MISIKHFPGIYSVFNLIPISFLAGFQVWSLLILPPQEKQFS